MKWIILLLMLFSFVFVYAGSPNDVVSAVGNKISDVSKNSDVYVGILGENLLKFQEFFMGVVEFITLGFFDIGGDMAFITFLFALLLFMVTYTTVGYVFDKFNFGIAFAVTILAMIEMKEEMLRTIFLNYEAMGITITIILPVLILLAFTFRIYQRAYEEKSETSPFYAEMFNLVFLVFFGVFFIRYSSSEEGSIAVMRLFSGWILIGMGIGQTVFYKVFAKMIHGILREKYEERKNRKKMRDEALDKIKEEEAKEIFSTGARRGGFGKHKGRYVSKASVERYARRFGNEKTKERFQK